MVASQKPTKIFKSNLISCCTKDPYIVIIQFMSCVWITKTAKNLFQTWAAFLLQLLQFSWNGWLNQPSTLSQRKQFWRTGPNEPCDLYVCMEKVFESEWERGVIDWLIDWLVSLFIYLFIHWDWGIETEPERDWERLRLWDIHRPTCRHNKLHVPGFGFVFLFF